METKRKKRRVLRTIKLTEISAVDRPCQQGAVVTIMKRESPASTSFAQRAAMLARTDELLAKFNQNHSPEDGRFTSGDGGSTAESSSVSEESSSVTTEHKDATLRWAQTALRVAKIASWALVVPAMATAFAGAAPVGIPFAITAALATLVTRASLTKAAAFIALDTGLTQLIKHRESQLAKAATDEDPILATLRAMQQELHAFNTERPMHVTNKSSDDSYEALVTAEIGRSAMPRHIAEQRLLEKGIRPDAAAQVLKSRAAVADFQDRVEQIRARDGVSATAALRKARVEHPDEFQRYQEA